MNFKTLICFHKGFHEISFMFFFSKGAPWNETPFRQLRHPSRVYKHSSSRHRAHAFRAIIFGLSLFLSGAFPEFKLTTLDVGYVGDFFMTRFVSLDMYIFSSS